ncbi:MAG: tetratricopeptide repeat protein [Sphingomicrobium sp.]
MSKSLRFAPAFTAIVMASAVAGCAAPQFGTRSASSSASGKDMANVGVATRALVAFSAQDYPTAVKYAEQAVTNSPNVAGFRALLGNAYFGSGRFASAESAFRDSLALNGNQPQVIVKVALVEIAQGKSAEAQQFLASARNMLEPADFGLALALAGQPQEAINVLEPAARQVGADARVRQNLALAYALIGDWESARTIAAQDVPGNLVDARIQEWMLFAKPATASDQVAALTGFRPVSGDPGQPTRLALRGAETRTAEAAPAPARPPVLQSLPAQVAEVMPQPVVEQSRVLPPVYSEPAVIAAAAAASPEAPAAYAAMAAFKQRAEMRKQAKSAAVRAPARHASLRLPTGNSTSVVQIGAYGSAKRVALAWNDAARRHASLRSYTPMSARFSGPNGLVYRLSVKGFADAEQAKDLCVSLRRAGGSCFVRSVAGDAPVQLASR